MLRSGLPDGPKGSAVSLLRPSARYNPVAGFFHCSEFPRVIVVSSTSIIETEYFARRYVVVTCGMVTFHLLGWLPVSLLVSGANTMHQPGQDAQPAGIAAGRDGLRRMDRQVQPPHLVGAEHALRSVVEVCFFGG